MRLPITIQWTKTVKAEQKLWLRRQSVIVGLEKDNTAMRQVIQRLIAKGASRKSKTPKAGVASL